MMGGSIKRESELEREMRERERDIENERQREREAEIKSWREKGRRRGREKEGCEPGSLLESKASSMWLRTSKTDSRASKHSKPANTASCKQAQQVQAQQVDSICKLDDVVQGGRLEGGEGRSSCKVALDPKELLSYLLNIIAWIPNKHFSENSAFEPGLLLGISYNVWGTMY